MKCLHQGIATYREQAAACGLSFLLALLAEVHGDLGRPAEGLEVVQEGLDHAAQTGERFYEAELHRLRGELLLRSPGGEASAEGCFLRAIELARSQGAKSWELRAATSLARLWADEGKRAQADALLAPVYGWFTEGFDTADLKEAKALLEGLA
jgi:predicted ATPase